MTPEQAQKRIQELIHIDLQEGTLEEVEVDDSIHDLTPFLFQDSKPSQAKGKKKGTSPVGKKEEHCHKRGSR
ncbi:MAG: hypothetical protein HY267_08235 [Deltaproteobacteria bacterium]|nr:hypothetical protein [Deltaproteobacteria bacterium]